VIENDRCLLLVIESESFGGIGCVRFDLIDESMATVTIYLLPKFVGRHLGVPALIDACSLAFSEWPMLRTIQAYIRSDNARSIRAFSKAGFDHRVSSDIPLNHQVKMLLDREGVSN
jgi:RimJ/RimL family protein N-acetyltransferase